MKKYTIGLITGALLAVSAMMFMGANTIDNQVGRFVEMNKYRILDTTNGRIWDRGTLEWPSDIEGKLNKSPGWKIRYDSVFESEMIEKYALDKYGTITFHPHIK